MSSSSVLHTVATSTLATLYSFATASRHCRCIPCFPFFSLFFFFRIPHWHLAITVHTKCRQVFHPFCCCHSFCTLETIHYFPHGTRVLLLYIPYIALVFHPSVAMLGITKKKWERRKNGEEQKQQKKKRSNRTRSKKNIAGF